MSSQQVLAGDVGGTKTRLAVFCKNDSGKFERQATRQYKSTDFPNLQSIIKLFLEQEKLVLASGCIGVPGPVSNGTVKITNLPWELSETEIEAFTNVKRIRLVNDLFSASAALPFLTETDLTVILPGRPIKDAQVAAVIAPGTGLGMGFLVKGHSNENIILPSEGGHARFAPSDALEEELLSFLRHRQPGGYVSIEHMLCGPGIRNIFSFCCQHTPELLSQELRQAVTEAKDPASEISIRALGRTDPICVQTMELFTSILANHCGNVAVTNMTTAGVYLGGGIPPKIAALLTTTNFARKFLERDKMSDLAAQIPVYLIKDDYVALTGAASLAWQELGIYCSRFEFPFLPL